MTNRATYIEGFQKKPKRHNHGDIRDYLRESYGDLPDHRRMPLLNRIEQACKHWFIQGGGDPEEFERGFNNEKI